MTNNAVNHLKLFAALGTTSPMQWPVRPFVRNCEKNRTSQTILKFRRCFFTRKGIVGLKFVQPVFVCTRDVTFSSSIVADQLLRKNKGGKNKGKNRKTKVSRTVFAERDGFVEIPGR